MRQGIACFIIALGLIPSTFVSAESVVWNQVQPDLIDIGTTAGANRWTVHLFDPNVTIHYRIAVYESNATGAQLSRLSNGATIPADSWVRFSFDPHKYTDISWFGTGRAYDTPYGGWFSGAVAPPSAERCTAKNLYQTGDTVYGKGTGKEPDAKLYAALSVEPPNKEVTITTQSTCKRVSGTSDMLCNFTQPETISALFTFAPTRGEFYAGQWRERSCRMSNRPMSLYAGERTAGGDYQLKVPARTIDFRLSINEITQDPPQQPAVTAAGAACIVGTSYAISMTANDPKGRDVRYFVDWNADGTSDQLVPSSGYVASGSTQTASRTYTTPGSKTVRVRAENKDGAPSPWASLTFTCAASDLPPTSTTTPFFEEDPFPNDGDPSDGPSINDLSLRALPSLVRTGNTTKVHWSSQNMASCEVTGTNGDSWSGLNSPVSGEASSAINGLVTYTLTCRAGGNTFAKSATVNVLPSWVEK